MMKWVGTGSLVAEATSPSGAVSGLVASATSESIASFTSSMQRLRAASFHSNDMLDAGAEEVEHELDRRLCRARVRGPGRRAASAFRIARRFAGTSAAVTSLVL